MIAILLLALVAGGVAIRRQTRLNRLSTACTDAARRKDWPALEALARDWVSQQSAPVAWFWLGTSLQSQKRFVEAEAAFAKVPLHELRGIDAAIARLEIQFHVFERPLDAIQLAMKLLQEDPRLASPRRHLIHFYAMTLQRPELIREIRLAIKHRVDLPEHYLYLFLLEDLSIRDAEEITRRWSETSPDSPLLLQAHQVHRLRAARGLVLATPTPELVRRYEQIRLEIVPSLKELAAQPIALEMLLLLTMDDSDIEEAGRLLARVPAEATEDPVFWRYRGWYASRSGDYPQAAESYHEALRLHPLGWQTRHEHANLLRLMGRQTDAGKVQSVAALGSELANEIRHLPHMQKASSQLLTRLAKYAVDCGDLEVSNAINRRMSSNGD